VTSERILGQLRSKHTSAPRHVAFNKFLFEDQCALSRHRLVLGLGRARMELSIRCFQRVLLVRQFLSQGEVLCERVGKAALACNVSIGGERDNKVRHRCDKGDVVRL
jgi:hypothetical protein